MLKKIFLSWQCYGITIVSSRLFAEAGLPVLTATASYTNGFQVLLSVCLKRQHYYICCLPSSWHSTDAQFVSFASMHVHLLYSVGLPWVLLYFWLRC